MCRLIDTDVTRRCQPDDSTITSSTVVEIRLTSPGFDVTLADLPGGLFSHRVDLEMTGPRGDLQP
ncbi:MAG: hypothetical protein HIU57_08455 [Acidobacteria bacterium]|nr:hypothetical protein [Acidobacteriota bacterium]